MYTAASATYDEASHAAHVHLAAVTAAPQTASNSPAIALASIAVLGGEPRTSTCWLAR